MSFKLWKYNFFLTLNSNKTEWTDLHELYATVTGRPVCSGKETLMCRPDDNGNYCVYKTKCNRRFLLTWFVSLVFFVSSISLFYHAITINYGTTYNHSEPNRTDSKKMYISIPCGYGRLANCLFEAVSLYGIAKSLNRQPIIYYNGDGVLDMVAKVKGIMPQLMEKIEYRDKSQNPTDSQTVPFQPKCCFFDDPKSLKNNTNQYISLTGAYYQSYKYFEDYRDEVRSFIKPRSENFNFGLPLSNSSNFITCIHIRRTDFVTVFPRHPTEKAFVVHAREFIRRRENQTNMVTVLLGDDQQFEQEIFKNDTNVFVSTNNPNDDLIYSRYNCDVVLITAPSSTFGFWLGYLSKGEKVYYLDITTTRDVVYLEGSLNPPDFFVSRWTSLKFDNVTNTVSLST